MIECMTHWLKYLLTHEKEVEIFKIQLDGIIGFAIQENFQGCHHIRDNRNASSHLAGIESFIFNFEQFFYRYSKISREP